MVCEKCGALVEEKASFCNNCGNKLSPNLQEINSDNNINNDNNDNNNNTVVNQPLFESSVTQEEKGKKKYILPIIGLVILLLIIVAVILISNKNKEPARAKVLGDLEKSDYLKFTLGENEFYLGDEISTYKKNGYDYTKNSGNDNQDEVVTSDYLATRTFYKDDEAQFLGAFYCSRKESCNFDQTLLLKINFYEDSDVVVNDYIKYGMKYDEVVKKYGKEDGYFYQGKDYLVWSFGEKGKIGEPYYILRFENNIFDGKKITDIRMGIWWYDGEYEHTVVKGKSEK